MIEIICESICDRCGERHEKVSQQLALPVGWTRLTRTTKWSENKPEYEIPTETKILCSECGKGFLSWFQKEAK